MTYLAGLLAISFDVEAVQEKQNQCDWETKYNPKTEPEFRTAVAETMHRVVFHKI